MILSPTSQIGQHHKVTNITMSPTSLSPLNFSLLGLNFDFIYQSQSRNSYIDQFFYNDAEKKGWNEGWNGGKKWAGIREPYFF